MQPKNEKDSLYRFLSRLDRILNVTHLLCKLSRAIDWSVFETELGPYYLEGQKVG